MYPYTSVCSSFILTGVACVCACTSNSCGLHLDLCSLLFFQLVWFMSVTLQSSGVVGEGCSFGGCSGARGLIARWVLEGESRVGFGGGGTV